MSKLTVYHGGYSYIRFPERRSSMIGREDQKENDLFFTCSLIDYVARKTKNRRAFTMRTKEGPS